jgi:hypothetical protein
MAMHSWRKVVSFGVGSNLWWAMSVDEMTDGSDHDPRPSPATTTKVNQYWIKPIKEIEIFAFSYWTTDIAVGSPSISLIHIRSKERLTSHQRVSLKESFLYHP